MHVLSPKQRPVPDPNNPFPLAAELLDPPFTLPVIVPKTPPDPVGAGPLGTLLCPTVNVVGFATAEADGTLPFPEGMTSMLLAVTLNFVGAIEIS
jgi:hypothetical protein